MERANGSPSLVIRSGEQRVVFGFIGGFFALVTFGPLTESSSTPNVIAALLVGVPISIFTIRAVRTGVFLNGDGIRIVNLLNTLSFRWAEIDRFEMKGDGLRWRNGALRLRDGRRVIIFSIAGPNPVTRPKNRDAERSIEQLNVELERQRGGAGSTAA